MADRGEIATRCTRAVADLDALEPLWLELHAHHSVSDLVLGSSLPMRAADESWRMRRAKYESWLRQPETFILIAERDGGPVGYAFVTVGPGLASWDSGERVAELETLSVLSSERGAGVGRSLLAAAWERLGELGIADLLVTTARTNEGARRFYEREGFSEGFVVYHARRGAPEAP